MKKQTKRYNMILIGLILVLLVFIVVWKLQKREDLYFHVGIAVYDLGDSFIESYIEELQEQIEEHNIAGKKVSYEIYDARGISTQQEKQLQYMYAQEYDLVLVNLLEPSFAARVLNELNESKTPVILFNREVEEKDLEIKKDVWYVGTDAEAAGKIQAKMLAQLWEKQQETVDKNQNGKIEYILVEGEESHYDTIRRTNGFLETSKELPLNQLQNLSADWKRELAFEKFAALDEVMIQDTEAIICNNDDMALGIYDYYKANQLDVPVILGINNSQEMNEKVLSGEIYGTVDNNVEDQVEKIDGLMRKVLEKNEADEPKIWYSEPYEIIKRKCPLRIENEEEKIR